MYNKGKINLQELAGMISLLEDNTEKFMIISSLFPEPEAIETRQELSEICLELDEGIKEKGGKKRIKREKADRDYNQYITDPTARFMLIKLLDENYSFKMTLDGHAIMHLPNSNRVLIERMLDKNGKPFYGAATYILDEDCFKRNEDAIVVDNKVKRNKLSQNAESRGVEKLIHSPTGWGKGIKEIFGIIHSSVRIFRKIVHIQCCYLEHLSGTLTVASCDQWCVYIYKISLLEKFVNCICNQGTHTENCLKCICSRS